MTPRLGSLDMAALSRGSPLGSGAAGPLVPSDRGGRRPQHGPFFLCLAVVFVNVQGPNYVPLDRCPCKMPWYIAIFSSGMPGVPPQRHVVWPPDNGGGGGGGGGGVGCFSHFFFFVCVCVSFWDCGNQASPDSSISFGHVGIAATLLCS